MAIFLESIAKPLAMPQSAPMALEPVVVPDQPARHISRVGQSVSALKAWHGLSNDDIASAMNVSLATLDRRLKAGRWLNAEVRSLATYFGVTTDALETGNFSLPESRLTIGYDCNRWTSRNSDEVPSQRVAA